MGTSYNFTVFWEEKMVWKHSHYCHGTCTWQCAWIRYLCAHMCTYMHLCLPGYLCLLNGNWPHHILNCCYGSAAVPDTASFSQGQEHTALLESTPASPAGEEPQWSQSLQGIKRTFLHTEVKLIIGRRILFSCENGTARLIFGQEHCSVPCKGLVDFNWRLPLFSWSCSLLEFSFVALPDMPEHLSS